jgi:hypothetical protein
VHVVSSDGSQASADLFSIGPKVIKDLIQLCSTSLHLMYLTALCMITAFLRQGSSVQRTGRQHANITVPMCRDNKVSEPKSATKRNSLRDSG